MAKIQSGIRLFFVQVKSFFCGPAWSAKLLLLEISIVKTVNYHRKLTARPRPRKVRNFDTPFPIAAQRATMRFLMGQEVGAGGADVSYPFGAPS